MFKLNKTAKTYYKEFKFHLLKSITKIVFVYTLPMPCQILFVSIGLYRKKSFVLCKNISIFEIHLDYI